MAKRVILIDDLTNEESESVQSIVFSVNGQFYETELSDASLAKLDKAMAPFIKNARAITPLRATAVNKLDEAPKIREWAKEQNLEVSERGRIPQEIVDKYHAAMGANLANAPTSSPENDTAESGANSETPGDSGDSQ